MTKETDVSIAHALLGVTESSINNDRALLGLCEVIADTVNLLEKRLSVLESAVMKTQDEIRGLKNFIKMIARDKEDVM